MNTPMKTFTNDVPCAPDGKTGQTRPFPQNIKGRVLFEDEYQPGVMDAPKKKRQKLHRNHELTYPLSLLEEFDSVQCSREPFHNFQWITCNEDLTDPKFDPAIFTE